MRFRILSKRIITNSFWHVTMVLFFFFLGDKVLIQRAQELCDQRDLPNANDAGGKDRMGGRGMNREDLSVQGPIPAHFQGYSINGCVCARRIESRKLQGHHCNHRNAGWSRRGNHTLSERQRMEYQNVWCRHLDYDYRRDRTRYPDPFPECQHQ